MTFIHAFCIYCLVSAVTTVLLLVSAVWHLKVPQIEMTIPTGRRPIHT
jgi:uncharacterized membrane protein